MSKPFDKHKKYVLSSGGPEDRLLMDFLSSNTDSLKIPGDSSSPLLAPSQTAAVAHIRNEGFCVENVFFDAAETLRQEFERAISLSLEANTPVSEKPLVYLHLPGAFQCLGAGADVLFSGDLLTKFINRLRGWGLDTLGVSHASSPMVRLYVSGNQRNFLRDDVSAKWHYMYCISRNQTRRASRVKILYDLEARSKRTGSSSLGYLVGVRLSFNELMIHSVESPYAIDNDAVSPNPLDGAVFLEGYLW